MIFTTLGNNSLEYTANERRCVAGWMLAWTVSQRGGSENPCKCSIHLLCWLPSLPLSSFFAVVLIIHHHELSRDKPVFQSSHLLKKPLQPDCLLQEKKQSKKTWPHFSHATLLKMKALVSNYIGLNADAIYK